jgi:hypothetical protein
MTIAPAVYTPSFHGCDSVSALSHVPFWGNSFCTNLLSEDLRDQLERGEDVHILLLGAGDTRWGYFFFLKSRYLFFLKITVFFS